ncbi:unnamed protein product [Agarophyton chilense]
MLSFLRLLSSLIVLTSAFAQAPTCRDRALFSHVRCDLLWPNECLPASQFGCILSGCDCALNQTIAGTNSCPDNELPIDQLLLSPGLPVNFRMGVNLLDNRLNVLFLVDGSPSMEEQLPTVISELSTLASALIINNSAIVGVAVYAGETSFDTFEAYTSLQSLTTNATAVQKALQLIPNLSLQNGPRLLLRAIEDSRSANIGWTGFNARRIIIVVGDKPGREPACATSDFQKVLDRNTLFDFINIVPSKFSFIAASVGNPGLDTGLSQLPQCPFRPLCLLVFCQRPEPAPGVPVAPGQLSTLANQVDGSFITNFSALEVYNAVLNILQLPNFQPLDGVLFRDTEEAVTPVSMDTCGDRVVVQQPNLPMALPALSFSTLDFTVSLADNACQNGPFDCILTIAESRNSTFVFELESLSVKACS